MKLVLLMLIVFSGSAAAVEIVSWDAGLKAMRGATHPAYAIYIGRRQAQILQVMRKEKTDTSNVLIIHLSAQEQVMNPFTNRPVSGKDFIANLTGPVNELTGGTFLFFNKDGILVPEMVAIHNFHKNRPKVLELYCKMMTSDLLGKLTLAEFARLNSMPIGTELLMEAQAGKHKDFTHLFKKIEKGSIYFRGVDREGDVHDPQKAESITVVTKNPNGEVFIAQMLELWIKLTVNTGNNSYPPPITILGPIDAQYQALDALKIKYMVGYLTEQQLQTMKTPMIVIPGNGERDAMEMNGFVPGEIIANYVLPEGSRTLVNNNKSLHPDIPLGDHDYEGDKK